MFGKINFDPSRFAQMLPYMVKGMLAIFVVISIIILVTMAISRIFNKKK